MPRREYLDEVKDTNKPTAKPARLLVCRASVSWAQPKIRISRPQRGSSWTQSKLQMPPLRALFCPLPPLSLPDARLLRAPVGRRTASPEAVFGDRRRKAAKFDSSCACCRGACGEQALKVAVDAVPFRFFALFLPKGIICQSCVSDLPASRSFRPFLPCCFYRADGMEDALPYALRAPVPAKPRRPAPRSSVGGLPPGSWRRPFRGVGADPRRCGPWTPLRASAEVDSLAPMLPDSFVGRALVAATPQRHPPQRRRRGPTFRLPPCRSGLDDSLRRAGAPA